MHESRPIRIDGSAIWSKSSLIREIYSQCSAPEWAGANWDAVYDVLTDLPEEAWNTPRVFDIRNEKPLRERLGADAVGFFGILDSLQHEEGWTVYREE